MNYEEFKENLAADVKSHMEGTDIGAVEVQFHEVNKVNYQYDAMTVKPEDERIGVNLNVSQLYEQYQESGDYDKAFETAVNAAERGLSNSHDIRISAEQLRNDALENAPVVRPAQIKGMSEVMYEIMGQDAASMGIPRRSLLRM